jgi:BirA family biotin operon repressor/biotin-[acetyl-CoA-carboxylase] ligase
MTVLTAELIRTALRDLPAIVHVEHHFSIGSTNDRARELAQADQPEIALISADEQTAGRGRQNRSWYTPAGTALALSLLVRPALPAQHAMRLTMLAGLAVVEGIERATSLRLALKWPNDVVAMSHEQLPRSSVSRQPLKVGGILTEAAFRGDALEYAVVGLGVNVNVDFSGHDELRNIATSLKELSGNLIDRAVALKEIVAAFVERYARLRDGDRLRAAWAARLINLGRDVRVQLGDEIVEGYAEGVADDGALLMRASDGTLRRLLSGDVTLHNV